jgi:hypothetical protein
LLFLYALLQLVELCHSGTIFYFQVSSHSPIILVKQE